MPDTPGERSRDDRSAYDGTQASDEFARRERFRNVVVSAQFETADAVRRFASSSRWDIGCSRRLLPGPEGQAGAVRPGPLGEINMPTARNALASAIFEAPGCTPEDLTAEVGLALQAEPEGDFIKRPGGFVVGLIQRQLGSRLHVRVADRQARATVEDEKPEPDPVLAPENGATESHETRTANVESFDPSEAKRTAGKTLAADDATDAEKQLARELLAHVVEIRTRARSAPTPAAGPAPGRAERDEPDSQAKRPRGTDESLRCVAEGIASALERCAATPDDLQRLEQAFHKLSWEVASPDCILEAYL